jgi:hypothetical protein
MHSTTPKINDSLPFNIETNGRSLFFAIFKIGNEGLQHAAELVITVAVNRTFPVTKRYFYGATHSVITAFLKSKHPTMQQNIGARLVVSRPEDLNLNPDCATETATLPPPKPVPRTAEFIRNSNFRYLLITIGLFFCIQSSTLIFVA